MHEIAAAQLAIDRQIEQRELALSIARLKANPNCPNILKSEWRLQRKLIDALAPFMSPTGTNAAYAKTPSAPEIDQATLESARHFGVFTADYLNALLAAPSPAFTFSAVGVSAYQFGNFGTAAKLLHPFKLTR